MAVLRPREIPVSLSSLPMFLSYSDGEGEGAGVGVALWCPGGRIVGGDMKFPMEVRQTWSRMTSAGDHYDIFEIEAVGPALILHNWIHLFTPGALWIHFIDNGSARATLAKGSSSVLSGECITVDKLSRGVMDGPRE